jgi:hypothetical protein
MLSVSKGLAPLLLLSLIVIGCGSGKPKNPFTSTDLRELKDLPEGPLALQVVDCVPLTAGGAKVRFRISNGTAARVCGLKLSPSGSSQACAIDSAAAFPGWAASVDHEAGSAIWSDMTMGPIGDCVEPGTESGILVIEAIEDDCCFDAEFLLSSGERRTETACLHCP